MSLVEMIHVDSTLAEELREELELVAAVFGAHLKSEHEAINDLCSHVEQYRGKMLRPALVLLSGLAVSDGVLSEDHRVVAAVVEMIHMATLVHDDVLDEAEVRRGGETVNSLHGNEMAVMLGDLLISKAFHLCSTMGNPEINKSLGVVTNTLCEGELIQLQHRNDLGLDDEIYYTIVQKKTASLIGASCRLGAILGGADESTSLGMERFGIASGVAFQITDDVLDLMGEQEVVGKSVGRDLDKGKMTLPVILALRDADDTGRRLLFDLIDGCDLEGLRSTLEAGGFITRALDRAAELVLQAKMELEALPPSPARDVLGVLADGIVERRF